MSEYTELQQLALDAGKGDKEATAKLKEQSPPIWCATLEFAGKRCITDGAQLIELVNLDAPYDSLMELEPTILDIQTLTDEQLDSITVIDESYEARIRNLINMVASTGTPLLFLGEWIRWVLVQCDRDIADNSSDLFEASNEVVLGIIARDKDMSWLVQSACFHYGHYNQVPVEEVIENFSQLEEKEQKEFLNDVFDAMNLTVRME